MSQHLSTLKAFGLVEAESEGREQFYRLRQPEMAQWIADGIDFVAHRVGNVTADDVASARAIWGLDTSDTISRPPNPSDGN